MRPRQSAGRGGVATRRVRDAKTTPPRPSGVLSRRRLFGLLDRARRCPVMWIAGPPGAGKTTLVATYLAARGLPNIWYQVDEGDGDVATFFYYLSRAASRLSGGPRGPLPLLKPEDHLRLPTFTRLFFESLYRRLRPPFALVIDNYQEAPDGSRFHEVIRDAATRLPAGGRLIVASRSEPPETLARLQATESIAFIRWEALRLTSQESRGIARLRGSRRVPEGVMHRLLEETDGWPAGLTLLLERATEDHGRPAAVPASTPQVVFDFFAVEILRRTDPDRQRFLLRTALLPSVTATMATALTGVRDAARILGELSRGNFFTERRPGVEDVYQYHPLFRDFLLNRLRHAMTPGELSTLQRRAAALLAGRGQVADAAGLLQQAGDWGGLARTIVEHAPALVAQGRGQTILEWAAMLPADVAENDGWLQYWLGTALAPWRPATARLRLERAFELFCAMEDTAGELSAWSGVVEALIYEAGDYARLDPWIVRFEELRRRHSRFPSPEIEIRVTSAMFGALMFRRPDHPEMATWADRMFVLTSGADADRRMLNGPLLATYFLWTGLHARAALAIDMLRVLADARNASPLAVISCRAAEATYHWQVGDPQRCLRCAAEGLETARASGIHVFDSNFLAHGVYGALVSGDPTAAGESLEKMSVVVGAQSYQAAHYHFLSAWNALVGDELPLALEHARIALQHSIDAGTPFPRVWNHLGMALILHASGERREAAHHLAQARELGRALRSDMLEFMFLLAEARFALDAASDGEALGVLRRAMALGRAQGYLMTRWWHPAAMARLCARALEENIEVPYVARLITSNRLVMEPPPVGVEAWPWPLRVRTFGELALSRHDRPITFKGKVQRKPLALLEALVALGGQDVPEAQVADLLWPDADGDNAHRALTITLHRLRDLLGVEDAVRLRDGRLSLDRRSVWVDVWSFEHLLREAERARQRGGADEAARLGEKALALYRGPFLGGHANEAWALSTGERLRDMFVRCATWLGRHQREL